MSEREAKEGVGTGEDRVEENMGWTALEVVVTVWFIGAIGYFYHEKGYLDLMANIWRFHFG